MDKYHDTDHQYFCYRCGKPLYDDNLKTEQLCADCAKAIHENLKHFSYDIGDIERVV